MAQLYEHGDVHVKFATFLIAQGFVICVKRQKMNVPSFHVVSCA